MFKLKRKYKISIESMLGAAGCKGRMSSDLFWTSKMLNCHCKKPKTPESGQEADGGSEASRKKQEARNDRQEGGQHTCTERYLEIS